MGIAITLTITLTLLLSLTLSLALIVGRMDMAPILAFAARHRLKVVAGPRGTAK